jgi:hypothetical protein
VIGPLLDALWPESWRPVPAFLEIRSIRSGVIRQSFFDLGQESANWGSLQSLVDHLAYEQQDVYYGVLPRVRMSGTNADVPTTTPFLWADVDAKKASSDLAEGKRLALEAINQFPTPPQIVVDSGGGYHCYWLLEEPVDLARAQEVMRWIARELRGDFVQDGARILRVPATTNWKREPTVARYLRFDLTRPRIRLGDLEGQMPVADDVVYLYPRSRVDEMPDWLTELIVQGAPVGQRSEACFRAVVWLLRYGRSPEEIQAIFRDHPAGIGAKVADMTGYSGARWLARTISAAEKAA